MTDSEKLTFTLWCMRRDALETRLADAVDDMCESGNVREALELAAELDLVRENVEILSA